MRDDRAATPVFLATMGRIAQHTARATFAANLFASGGIDTVTAGATEGVDDVVSAYREAGRPPSSAWPAPTPRTRSGAPTWSPPCARRAPAT